MTGSKYSHADEREQTFRDGELIVEEGDHSRDMFVIQSGSVRITKHAGDQRVELARLERGDFFGEMSLLESLPRDASAHAVGETRLLVIGASALLVRVRRDPTFAFEMLRRLSGRVRQLNARWIQVLEESGAPRSVSSMLYAASSDRDDQGSS
jgi:CRP-like cAMP-binding protein